MILIHGNRMQPQFLQRMRKERIYVFLGLVSLSSMNWQMFSLSFPQFLFIFFRNVFFLFSWRTFQVLVMFINRCANILRSLIWMFVLSRNGIFLYIFVIGISPQACICWQWPMSIRKSLKLNLLLESLRAFQSAVKLAAKCREEVSPPHG